MLVCQTPLRISFLGGGTDLPEYYENAGKPGRVISTAIDKYTYVVVNKLFRKQWVCNYSKKEICNSIDEIQHEYIREVLKHFNIDFGLEVTTLADIPSEGSGLASSSSILVGLIHAVSTLVKADLNHNDIANLACRIEMETLNKPIGKQDQFAVSYGGFNLISFRKKGKVVVKPLEVDEELERMLVLVNTGIHRKSSDILTDQRKNTQRKVQKYDRMAEYVDEGLRHINAKRFEDFGFTVLNSMRVKQELAKNIINDNILGLVQRCVHDVIGYKICGAGGGGYLLFISDNPKGIISAYPDLDTFRVKFDNQGSRIIFNNEK